MKRTLKILDEATAILTGFRTAILAAIGLVSLVWSTLDNALRALHVHEDWIFPMQFGLIVVIISMVLFWQMFYCNRQDKKKQHKELVKVLTRNNTLAEEGNIHHIDNGKKLDRLIRKTNA